MQHLYWGRCTDTRKRVSGRKIPCHTVVGAFQSRFRVSHLDSLDWARLFAVDLQVHAMFAVIMYADRKGVGVGVG